MSMRVAATDFLVIDEAACLHEVLVRTGFQLRLDAEATHSKSGRRLTVRLVWRNRFESSVVLALRIATQK